MNTHAANPIYPVQILARNIEAPVLGKLGHVAMAIGPHLTDVATQVIEVSGKQPVIRISSISSYKSKSLYWGSRYGIAKTQEQAIAILRAAHFQKDMGCARYTLTSNYHINKGGYDSKGHPMPTQCGVFRCDTFINYIYHEGGYTLPTYSPPGKAVVPTLPKLVFKAFPLGNGDGPYAYSPKADTVPQSSIRSLSTAALVALSPEQFMAFVDSPEVSTPDAPVLLALAQSSTLSPDARRFVVDKLGFIGNSSTLAELMALYPSVDASIQEQILVSTQNLYQTQGAGALKEDLFRFYAQVLDKDQRPVSIEIAARALIALGTKEEILSHLDRINQALERLAPRIHLGISLELLDQLPEKEDTLLPNLIDFLTQHDNGELNSVFHLYLVHKLNHSHFNQSSKRQISNFLSQPHLKKETTLFADGEWLEASSLVNSNSLTQAGHFIAEFLAPKSNKEQKRFILGLSNHEYLKKAFNVEPVLVAFARNYPQAFRSSVGHPRLPF
jgi:hypothetical protein